MFPMMTPIDAIGLSLRAGIPAGPDGLTLL